MFYGLLLVSDGTSIKRTKSVFHTGARITGYTVNDGAGHNYYTSPTTDPSEPAGNTPGIEDDVVDNTTTVALSTLTNFTGKPLFITITKEDASVANIQLNGQVSGSVAGVYLLEKIFNLDSDGDPTAAQGDETDRRLLAKFRIDLGLLQQGPAGRCGARGCGRQHLAKWLATRDSQET